MARFVVHLHIPPAEYYALTWAQRTAIVNAWEDANKRR